MNKTVLKVRKYKAGYELRTERCAMSGCDEPVVLTSAYTPNGDYIGSSKMARYLIVKRGIAPEIAKPDHNICAVGYCQKESKWYGWSHRAMCGFGIGDRLFEEEYGNDQTLFSEHGSETIKNMEEARLAAVRFAESVS